MIFTVFSFTKHYYSGYIRKNDMAAACDANGGRGDVPTGFWWGNLRETVHFADLGIDGTIPKRIFKEMGLEGVDWIPLAQKGAEWIAHVNTIITLRMPYNAGNYLASRGTINFS